MKSRFYNKFLTCTFLGALGEYMALATLSWYLLETYNDMLVIGKVLSFRILPRFFMGFVGGYFADKYDRRKMMLLIYGIIMLVSFLQTVFITIFQQPMWCFLAVLLFIRSVFDGAEPSVRNAILPHIVDEKSISKAVGYYATGLNLAAIIAPMIAAIMMSYFSIAVVFWVDWLLQIPSFVVLFFIPKMDTEYIKQSKVKFVKAYREVIKFIYDSPMLLQCILSSVVLMILLFPFGAMLSIYVKEGLKLDVKAYGYLSGVEAAGAVLSGIILHHVFSDGHRVQLRWYVIGLFSGLCLVFLACKPSIYYIYTSIFFFGLLSQLFRSYSRVMFQKNTPDVIRGKVMSIIISDSGFVSLGLLFFTFLTEKISIEKSIALMGLCTMLCMTVILGVAIGLRKQNELPRKKSI